MATYHLMSWGANSHGQLGLGLTDKEEILVPEEVDLSLSNLNPENIIKIKGGGGHTLILDKLGNTYICGGFNDKNRYKESQSCSRVFNLMKDLEQATSGQKIVDIVCGWDSFMVLTNNGQVFVWGSNSHGQLGITSDSSNPRISKPTKVPINQPISKIAMGLRHSAVVTNDCRVLMSGDCSKGQLGLHVNEKSNLSQFTEISDLPEIESISCGQHHTVAISKDKKSVFTWGSNKYGQLGVDTSKVKSSFFPIKVDNIHSQGDEIHEAYCGWTHTVVLTSKKDIISWGRNTYGQLGYLCDNFQSVNWRPKKLNLLKQLKAFSIGSEHNVLLYGNGTIMCWGWNEHGNCGNGNIENVLTPVPIILPEKSIGIIIGTGYGSSFAVMKKEEKNS